MELPFFAVFSLNNSFLTKRTGHISRSAQPLAFVVDWTKHILLSLKPFKIASLETVNVRKLTFFYFCSLGSNAFDVAENCSFLDR
jgi:hypothetical protein